MAARSSMSFESFAWSYFVNDGFARFARWFCIVGCGTVPTKGASFGYSDEWVPALLTIFIF